MVLAVIPSRFQSRRFPGKALALVGGVPLVVRVARRVRDAGVADAVLVATDDRRIADVVARAGFAVHLSGARFRSGSDRVADAARTARADQILNVQGDEPLIDRAQLLAALGALRGRDLGTAASPLLAAELDELDAVKVEIDGEGRALGFSRRRPTRPALLHLGVYAFQRAALQRFAALPSSPGELAEDLEQLRALEQGMTIGVATVQRPGRAVNRPADLARVEALLTGAETTGGSSS